MRRMIITATIALLLLSPMPTLSARQKLERKPSVGTAAKLGPEEQPPRQNNQAWLPLVQMPQSAPPPNLAELITPGFDYATWYEAETGYAGNPEYFGAYALTPVGDTLYLGFGTARPAEDGNNGALFASTDAITVTAISPLDEQGFIGMTPHNGVIYIPGADPTDRGPDHQWDWGNTYVYSPPDDFTKHRNLPNVIHTWGLWHHPTQDRLYAAVSSHQGDYKTWSGEIFVSADQGNSWARLADRDDGVGEYRTYDITGLGGKLYATWNDVYQEPCGLAQSDNEGNTWTRLPAFTSQTACRTRLFAHHNHLLTLTFDRSALLALNSRGAVTHHRFPGFSVKTWAYNYLAEDSAGRIYTITEDGRVMRTANLNAWETLVSGDRAFITIAYWPEKDWIVLADRGRDYANLWKIDLSSVAAFTPPPTPAVAIQQHADFVTLDWPDSTGAYRVYRSESPYFTSHLSNLQDQPTQATIDMPLIADENHFYLVRSKDASANLSLPSNRTGVFHFALVPG